MENDGRYNPNDDLRRVKGAVTVDKALALRYGLKNAIPAIELAIAAEITERQLRDVINDLIDAGRLIGSSDEGYYTISTWAEYDKSTARLRNQLKHLSRRICQLEKNAETLLGNQLTLDNVV